jgi:hypothetical protein
VVEVEVDLHHNATGKDLSGLLHRARQTRAIARELTRRKAWRPTPNGPTSGKTRSAETLGGAGSPRRRDPATPGGAGSPGWEGSPGTREGDAGSPQPPPPQPPPPQSPPPRSSPDRPRPADGSR